MTEKAWLQLLTLGLLSDLGTTRVKFLNRESRTAVIYHCRPQSVVITEDYAEKWGFFSDVLLSESGRS